MSTQAQEELKARIREAKECHRGIEADVDTFRSMLWESRKRQAKFKVLLAQEELMEAELGGRWMDALHKRDISNRAIGELLDDYRDALDAEFDSSWGHDGYDSYDAESDEALREVLGQSYDMFADEDQSSTTVNTREESE